MIRLVILIIVLLILIGPPIVKGIRHSINVMIVQNCMMINPEATREIMDDWDFQEVSTDIMKVRDAVKLVYYEGGFKRSVYLSYRGVIPYDDAFEGLVDDLSKSPYYKR